MADYKIFSDGSCDIPISEQQALDIETLPFYISFNGNDYYKELTELPLNEFYNKIINEKAFPKTSLPSVQDYINAFTPYVSVGKGIICFTITHTLSGSLQSAQTAKDILLETYPDAKIYIINSFLATGAQNLLVKECVRMRDAGFSIEKNADMCEKLKTNSKIIFMVGTLTYLEKGGRIGKIAALSGGLLNIKPLIILENGEIRVGGAVRGRKKAISKLVSLTSEFFKDNNENPSDYLFTIGTTNTPEEIDEFKTQLINSLGNLSFINDGFQIGAAIASHTGPDTIGVCFIKDYTKI